MSSALVIFLVVIAILFVIVIVMGAIGWARRSRMGRTLSNSTFGNNIEGRQDVGPSRAPPPRGTADNEMREETGGRRGETRS